MANNAGFGPFGSPMAKDNAETWAFIDGMAAYEAGEARDANPFPPGYDNRQAWLDGWLTACEEKTGSIFGC